MGNQFPSCCELNRLAEDDEIHNVNDEQVEEEPATEGDDEDNQEDGTIGICDPNHCHSLSPSLCHVILLAIL